MSACTPIEIIKSDVVGSSSEMGILEFILSDSPDRVWKDSFHSYPFAIGGGGLSSISGDRVGPNVHENRISWRSIHRGFINSAVAQVREAVGRANAGHYQEAMDEAP